MKTLYKISTALIFFTIFLIPLIAKGQVVSTTVYITASTPLPISTGLIANNTSETFLVLAAGALSVPALSDWAYTGGWFDPSGLVELRRDGQYFLDMPFGSVIGTFYDLLNGFYIGDGGTFGVEPLYVGREFKLGMNMSSSDHTSMEGLIVVHVLKIPGNSVESRTLVVDASTSLPVATGLTVNDIRDRFIVISEGAVQVTGLSSWPYTNGWFDPSGLMRLRRTGQVYANMPYGSLFGFFEGENQGFYIGDCGTFTSDKVGKRLRLGLNMSSSDHTSSYGSFTVHVIKIPSAQVGTSTVPSSVPIFQAPSSSVNLDEPVKTASIFVNRSTTLPIGTGLVAENRGERFIILTEGVLRNATLNTWIYTHGWFDPSGMARFYKTDQIFIDMPYGSLMGTFYDLANGFYVGDGGAFDVQSSDLGRELKLGLNWSSSDQNNMEGIVAVHVVKIPPNIGQSNTVILTASSAIPVSTDLTPNNTNDRFIILTEGGVQVPDLSSWDYTNGWFDPSGLTVLRRTGQYYLDMPYGSVMGTFSNLSSGFYLGDGGTFQPNALNTPLKLGLNMSQDDYETIRGSSVVHAIRLPIGGIEVVYKYQYAVKFLCGRSKGEVVAPGEYLTAINIHNPQDTTIIFRKKVAKAFPPPSSISQFSSIQTLKPDSLIEIDCGEIRTSINMTGFIKGFVVIESDSELDVVAVYTGAETKKVGSGPVNAIHMERVPPRIIK